MTIFGYLRELFTSDKVIMSFVEYINKLSSYSYCLLTLFRLAFNDHVTYSFLLPNIIIHGHFSSFAFFTSPLLSFLCDVAQFLVGYLEVIWHKEHFHLTMKAPVYIQHATIIVQSVKIIQTRMHSSRMRTVRYSGRRGGGVSQHALGRVGCVSQHALGRGVSALWGCLPGVVWPGGLSRQVGGGGFAQGVSAWRGCLAREVSGQGSVCRGGGVSAQGVSATHTLVNRITDACENITLPQLPCGQ